MNVFRKDKWIRHFYATELLFAKSEPGQNARHVDLIWPLWNLLDFTLEGRGKDWYPKLDYGDIRDIKGAIPKPRNPVSLEDMDKAVQRRAMRK